MPDMCRNCPHDFKCSAGGQRAEKPLCTLLSPDSDTHFIDTRYFGMFSADGIIWECITGAGNTAGIGTPQRCLPLVTWSTGFAELAGVPHRA